MYYIHYRVLNYQTEIVMLHLSSFAVKHNPQEV